MLAVERTHRLRHDHRWMPTGVRRAARLASGAVWAGTGLAIAGTIIAAPLTLLLWKGFVLVGTAGAVVGQQAGHAVRRRQVRRMTHGRLELAAVDARPEGELVTVRGRIEVDEPLPGTLVDTAGVYRRLLFRSRGTWVHEGAIDFALVDDRGHRVHVQAAGARWLVPRRELVTYPAARLARDQVSARVRQLVAGRPTVDAFEQVLAVGTEVQVVGYTTATPDPSGRAAGYRAPPQRATLRSGPDLPLVIVAAADLSA